MVTVDFQGTENRVYRTAASKKDLFRKIRKRKYSGRIQNRTWAAYFCFYRNTVMTIYYPVLLNLLKSFRLKYSETQSWLMKNWH
jgi:hypothetical protein